MCVGCVYNNRDRAADCESVWLIRSAGMWRWNRILQMSLLCQQARSCAWPAEGAGGALPAEGPPGRWRGACFSLLRRRCAGCPWSRLHPPVHDVPVSSAGNSSDFQWLQEHLVGVVGWLPGSFLASPSGATVGFPKNSTPFLSGPFWKALLSLQGTVSCLTVTSANFAIQ